MKVLRVVFLLIIVYFLFPISIKVLSQYDMENILLGKAPAFSRLARSYDHDMGKLYYGFLYRIVSVRKQVEPSGNGGESMIIGPMVTYHSLLHKVYFWTGDFFEEMQSLRIVRSNPDMPIII